jgi:hypothetical protein
LAGSKTEINWSLSPMLMELHSNLFTLEEPLTSTTLPEEIFHVEVVVSFDEKIIHKLQNNSFNIIIL